MAFNLYSESFMNTQDSESFRIRSELQSDGQGNQSGINSDLITVLQRAAILARKGDLSQAENLLTPLIKNTTPRTGTMDLLAKIYAQQGRIDQAQALWMQASQRDPSNLHFLAALRLCAQYRKPRIQQFILQHSRLVVAICLWWLLATFLILYFNA